MSWLTIRPRPVLFTAFRSEGGLAAAAALGTSAPKARQICSLGREPQGGYTKHELAAKPRQTNESVARSGLDGIERLFSWGSRPRLWI